MPHHRSCSVTARGKFTLRVRLNLQKFFDNLMEINTYKQFTNAAKSGRRTRALIFNILSAPVLINILSKRET